MKKEWKGVKNEGKRKKNGNVKKRKEICEDNKNKRQWINKKNKEWKHRS